MLALYYSTVLILAFACTAQSVCQELEQDRTPPAQPLLSAQQPELGVLLDESEQVHLLLLESIVSAWDGIVEQQEHQPQEDGHQEEDRAAGADRRDLDFEDLLGQSQARD